MDKLEPLDVLWQLFAARVVVLVVVASGSSAFSATSNTCDDPMVIWWWRNSRLLHDDAPDALIRHSSWPAKHFGCTPEASVGRERRAITWDNNGTVSLFISFVRTPAI